MGAFFDSFAIFAGIALVASAPALVLTLQRDLPDTRRRFWISIGVFGVFCGLIGSSSDELVRRCRGSGSAGDSCHDYGADGFLVMLVIGFVAVALGKAISIYRY